MNFESSTTSTSPTALLPLLCLTNAPLLIFFQVFSRISIVGDYNYTQSFVVCSGGDDILAAALTQCKNILAF
jgi:hypothetical protein